MNSPLTSDLNRNFRAVLLYPLFEKENVSYLLVAEKLQKIGKGRLNGWGGKIDPGESILDAVYREFSQETGGARIDPDSLRYRGLIDFHNYFSDGRKRIFQVYVFVAEKIIGTIKKTEEMGVPQLCPISKRNNKGDLVCILPFHLMMPGDKYFLPPILGGERVAGKVEYTIDEGGQASLVKEPIIVSAPWLSL